MAEPFDLIKVTIEECLGKPSGLKTAEARARKTIAGQYSNLHGILSGKAGISYRDGVIIQLAYGLTREGPIDLTVRHPGARSVAQKMGALFSEQHIEAVRDAYQNIGKNTTKLVRGNVAEWDSFLEWASAPDREKEELKAAFEYACARVAATARPIRPFPDLDWSRLTFARVTKLFRAMFEVGTEGANEQFVVAALLHGLVEQAGIKGYRVETKSLNASDKSSRTAGDVQVLAGTRVVEAYEITANPPEEKLRVAEKTIKEHDLSRLHIVARVVEREEVLSELIKHREDISVLDIAEFTSSVLSALTKQHRAMALERLYEFLDRYQPEVDRVNRFVELLSEYDLVKG